MDSQLPNIILLVILLVAIGGSVFKRDAMAENIRFLFIWVGILLALFVGYRLYDGLRPINRDIDPASTVKAYYSNYSGSYILPLSINGQNFEAIVDTGASYVAIPYEVAQSLGIDVKNMHFNIPISTANGPQNYAETRLDIHLENGHIWKNQSSIIAPEDALEQILVGLNALNLTHSIQIQDQTMLLNVGPAS